ncbi:hypothetical protein A2U01_0114156, partial [Trifolium medium]|nr:hypothetical protein [Trifolium medium]
AAQVKELRETHDALDKAKKDLGDLKPGMPRREKASRGSLSN